MAGETFFGGIPPTNAHGKRKTLEPGIKGNLQGDGGSLWGEFIEYGQLDFLPQ